MVFNIQALADAGYRVHRCWRGAEERPLYQKAVRDEAGTRTYFINVWEYEFADSACPIRHSAEVQFTKGEMHIDIEPMFPGEPTIADIEAFFAMAYERLECTPYDF